MSILEVLRNQQSATNMLPPGGIPRSGYSVVWLNYVRSLGAGPDRTRYFLIPGIEDVRLPASCLRSLSPPARRRYEAEERAQRGGSVTLEAFNGEDEAAAFPYTVEAIQKGATLLAVADPSNSTLAIASVVPDGVASVTITAASGKAITAPVTNNLALASPPAGGLKSLTIRWYGADGSLIKTIPSEGFHKGVVVSAGEPVQLTVAPPPAVVRAGKRQLTEFERGRTVMAQSGCLACHRIGQSGNPGPGPSLDHVGSRLSRRGIEHALIDPTAPMPSFKHLPAGKFKALVTFLSDLH
jgi:hypothetical protein